MYPIRAWGQSGYRYDKASTEMNFIPFSPFTEQPRAGKSKNHLTKIVFFYAIFKQKI
jgi:hypothetical protein